MLLIKHISLNKKWKLFFCFLSVFYSHGFSQPLQNKIIQFYNNKKSICYTFTEKRYSQLAKAKPLVSHGKVKCYREDNSIFYSGTQSYDIPELKEVKFETVNNRWYFGTNCYLENFFKNYVNLEEKKRYYAYLNSPKDILKPDTSLSSVFFDPLFISSITKSSKDFYKIELTDTTRHEFDNLDGYRSETRKVFLISKKDYSILNYSHYVIYTVGDVIVHDSVVYTYKYFELPFKAVKKEVNSFRPLTGKAPVMPELPKDTIKVFPELNLPDTSGLVRKINSKYILVDFWYKACGPCLANMKQLDKLNFKDVEIVTINVRDSLDEDVRKIISKHKFTFLFGGKELAKKLAITAYPTMYLLDKDRTVLYKHVGVGDIENLKAVILKLNPD